MEFLNPFEPKRSEIEGSGVSFVLQLVHQISQFHAVLDDVADLSRCPVIQARSHQRLEKGGSETIMVDDYDYEDQLSQPHSSNIIRVLLLVLFSCIENSCIVL